jgi:ribonuclease G
MSKELVISANRHETKVAILEEDVLVEVHFQRSNEYSLAGSIHKGRVTRVLPGMQSAFVDLGLERDTFLYVSDFFDDHHDDLDKVGDEKPARGRERGRERRGRDRDRDRDRGRGARTEAAETKEEVEAVEEGVEPPPVVEAEAFGGEAAEAAAPAAAEPALDSRPERGGERQDRGDRFGRGRGRDRDRDRRGGRRRGRDRDRDRRGGLPESKFASEVRETAEPAREGEGAGEEAEAPREVFLLPGESLAKYRRAAQAPKVDPVIEAAASEIEEEVNDIEEVGEELEAAAEEGEASAEEAAAPPPVVEESAWGVGEEIPYLNVPDDVDVAEVEEVDAIEEAREELLTETEEDDLDIDAAQEEAEEMVASGEMEALEVDGEEEPEAAGAEGEEGPEPARQPHSLTAALRERDRGSRYQSRGRRGRRRRGRGDDNRGPETSGEPAAAEAVEEAPAAVSEEALELETAEETTAAAEAPSVERQQRGRDRDRERGRERGKDRDREREREALPLITDLLKAGQEILVQIAKEPIGQKGARITSHIALPGRYCVYMPTVDHNGVSRKIASDEERHRLKRILQAHRQGMPGGFIIRTAGEGHTEEEIASDMQFLHDLWVDIRTKAEKRKAPCLVHHDLDIVQRTLRDQVTSDFKTIWLDNEELFESTLQFVQRFQPALVNRVKLWTRPVPIFDAFNITAELEKALRPKVWLKSGGYIVINQTEALVAIDVNTGKFVGKSNRLEDTIVKTNTEAVKEIARQVRLRDLGGIIVVDFIDMDERKNRQKVMQALEEAMRPDRAPYKILQFNDFGLVAITRKRVKQSLERTLCMPCVYCEGSGTVKNVQTVIGEIMLEAQKLAKSVEDKNVVLRVHPEVAKVLKSHRNHFLEDLEAIFGKPVLVSGDPAVHIEKFDLA